MAKRTHHYQVELDWTGNEGKGTCSYLAYSRNFLISGKSKPDILASSDPAFLGESTRWNPEELLVASVAACHKLWYLHLCAEAGVSVYSYKDRATGVMTEENNGHFTGITLNPDIIIRAGDDIRLASDLHHRAHEACFIANSLNFSVLCEPSITHLHHI